MIHCIKLPARRSWVNPSNHKTCVDPPHLPHCSPTTPAAPVLTHRTCGDPPCLPHPCQPAIPMLTRDPCKNRRIHGSHDPHPLKPIPMATGTVFWWVRVRVSKIYPWVTPVTHYLTHSQLHAYRRSSGSTYPHTTSPSRSCTMAAKLRPDTSPST
jgi:hypothetical protein